MTASTGTPRLPAGIVGCVTLLAIGWTGLLIPSLIRSIEGAFAIDDAVMGVVYLVWVVAYTVGGFGGGPLTERFGRPRVLGGAALLHGLGIIGLGLAPTLPWFLFAAAPAATAAGLLDGGANGVVLDLYRERRGRAMNLLHLFFSLGALSAPVLIGTAVVAGVAWQAVFVGTGLVVLGLAVAYAVVPMPRGEHVDPAPDPATSSPAWRRMMTGPLLLLGLAIGLYVASEMGVSSWLVRFLEPAPLTTATLALTLYWTGIAAGRAISSVIADRFDHRRFTITCSVILAGGVALAVTVPSLPLTITCFAIAGVASGPIFPMIVAIGGDRYPDRSASVAGILTGMGNIGAIAYPPMMGFLSVTIGLGAAMFGNALLALAAAATLVVFGRNVRDGVPAAIGQDARTASG